MLWYSIWGGVLGISSRSVNGGVYTRTFHYMEEHLLWTCQHTRSKHIYLDIAICSYLVIIYTVDHPVTWRVMSLLHSHATTFIIVVALQLFAAALLLSDNMATRSLAICQNVRNTWPVETEVK